MYKNLFNKLNNSAFFAFFAFAFLLFLFLLFNNITKFPSADASGYMRVSESFNLTSGFNMPDTEIGRGYSFPLVLFLFKGFNFLPIAGFWLFWSLFLSLLFTVLAPKVLEYSFGTKFNTAQKLVCSLLFIIFWPGLILFPLSDLPALMLLLITVILLIRISKQKNIALLILYYYNSSKGRLADIIKENKLRCFTLGAIFLTLLPALFSSVESRFAIGVWFLAFYFLVKIPYGNVLAMVRAKPLLYIAIFVILAGYYLSTLNLVSGYNESLTDWILRR